MENIDTNFLHLYLFMYLLSYLKQVLKSSFFFFFIFLLLVLLFSSVLKVLALRKSQGQNILEVLRTIRRCLDSLGQPHCFHPPCVLFLLELLACQKDFTK